MKANKNFAVFIFAFVVLMTLQFYYWQLRSIPRSEEGGSVPMDDATMKARISDGKPFIRFFYTYNCGFSSNMLAVADWLEQKYPIERVNAAKYCWGSTKVLDCPSMVPTFVIYSNGEKVIIYGERGAELVENATLYGKSAISGVLDG